MTPEPATDARLVAPSWLLWWGLVTATVGVLIAIYSKSEHGAVVVLVTAVIAGLVWGIAMLLHAVRIRRRNEPYSVKTSVSGWVGSLAGMTALVLTPGGHPKEMLMAQVFNGAAIGLACFALWRRRHAIQFARTGLSRGK